jgi:hypothetical protein
MRPPSFELMGVEIASLGNTIALRCSNLSKSLEMLSNASTRTCSCLQRFCKLRNDLAKYGAVMGRRRSGDRIPSAPLQKCRILQVKREGWVEVPDKLRASYCNRYCSASSEVQSALSSKVCS